MFCKNCGNSLNDSASFCNKCGNSVNNQNRQLIQAQYYSEDWTKKGFAVASLPYFDVMADSNFLYFIKLPRYSSSTAGLIIGLFLFNIVGAFVGYSIGNSSDRKKRKKYRSFWLSPEQKLTSGDYEKDVNFKVPLKKSKELLSLDRHKITLFHNNEKIIFQKNKAEVEKLNNYLKAYVL